MLRRSMSPRSLRGFTLVELLVVIGIIALLISILMPTLSRARESAKAAASLSNLRQLGNGVLMYINEYRGFYPCHSSIATTPPTPRHRWADYIFPYVKSTKVFISPMLNGDEFQLLSVPFAHTVQSDNTPYNLPDEPGQTIYWGGYGYNFQYLGNSRVNAANPRQFHARAGSEIKASAQTIMIADTHGRIGFSAAKYAIDPPLASLDLGSHGPRGAGAYGYAGGTDGTFDPNNPSANTPGDPSFRATPAERNKGYVNVVFCDGHGEAMKLKDMDDFNGDGFVDNGYWNGKANPNVR